MLKFFRRNTPRDDQQEKSQQLTDSDKVQQIVVPPDEPELTASLAEVSNLNDEIDSFVKYAPYIKSLMGEEIGLYIADTTHMRYAEHGVVKLNMKPGRRVSKNSVTDLTIKRGERVVERVAKELFGIAYIGTGSPIKNNKGQVIGAIVTVTPITLQETLSTSALVLEETVNTIATAIHSLVATSQEMSATSITLQNSAQDINNEIKKTDEVGVFITDVSERTHLLGLNASIEAARAGEHGRGFSIVANEIRKMSYETKDSVKEIKQNLKEMKNSIAELAAAFENITAISEHQAASVQEISAAMQNLLQLSTELKKNSDNLLN